MGIFDEAIREHLELKRQHGAGDSELRELEDAAFGAPARPGEPAVAEAPPAPDTEAPTELASIQETPELPEPTAAEAARAEEDAPQDLPEIEEPPPAPDSGTVAVETEEHPPPEGASEPEPAPEPVQDPNASTIDQPTELYDAQDADLPAEAPAEPAEVEDEFFSEQSLSDELDQALAEEEESPQPEAGLEPEAGALPPEPAPVEEEPPPVEPKGEGEEGEDVLEETPEFLQDTPEHDRLWFEQRPPKDFDFDD